MASFVSNFVVMATGVSRGTVHHYPLCFSPWKWFQWISRPPKT